MEIRLPKGMRDGSVQIPTVWALLADQILNDPSSTDTALALAAQIRGAAEHIPQR
jgi:hypothetical protein